MSYCIKKFLEFGLHFWFVKRVTECFGLGCSKLTNKERHKGHGWYYGLCVCECSDQIEALNVTCTHHFGASSLVERFLCYWNKDGGV